jgi:hypothetical protein
MDNKVYIWTMDDHQCIFTKDFPIDIETLNTFNCVENNNAQKKHILILMGGNDGKLYILDLTLKSNKGGVRKYDFQEYTLLKDRRKPIHIISFIMSKGYIAIVDDDRNIT